MALRETRPEWKHIKTYATEKALRKRIEEDKELYPEYQDRFLIVRTPEGRYTAIISLDMSIGGYLGRYDFLKL